MLVYSPDAKLLGKIAPPVNPRNLSFSDSDLHTLYMVGNSIFRVRLDVSGFGAVLRSRKAAPSSAAG
jgi:sugar lactone lactonase YvrE